MPAPEVEKEENDKKMPPRSDHVEIEQVCKAIAESIEDMRKMMAGVLPSRCFPLNSRDQQC